MNAKDIAKLVRTHHGGMDAADDDACGVIWSSLPDAVKQRYQAAADCREEKKYAID